MYTFPQSTPISHRKLLFAFFPHFLFQLQGGKFEAFVVYVKNVMHEIHSFQFFFFFFASTLRVSFQLLYWVRRKRVIKNAKKKKIESIKLSHLLALLRDVRIQDKQQSFFLFRLFVWIVNDCVIYQPLKKGGFGMGKRNCLFSCRFYGFCWSF